MSGTMSFVRQAFLALMVTQLFVLSDAMNQECSEFLYFKVNTSDSDKPIHCHSGVDEVELTGCDRVEFKFTRKYPVTLATNYPVLKRDDCDDNSTQVPLPFSEFLKGCERGDDPVPEEILDYIKGEVCQESDKPQVAVFQCNATTCWEIESEQSWCPGRNMTAIFDCEDAGQLSPAAKDRPQHRVSTDEIEEQIAYTNSDSMMTTDSSTDPGILDPSPSSEPPASNVSAKPRHVISSAPLFTSSCILLLMASLLYIRLCSS